MLDAFETCECCSEGSHGADLAPQKDHLHAVVVIEVHMRGCDDVMMCVVLDVGHLLFELPLVVIIDERQHAHRVFIGILDPFFHEPGPNQIPEGLRAGSIAGPIDELIEFLQQIRLDGDAKTNQGLWGHGSTFFLKVTRGRQRIKGFCGGSDSHGYRIRVAYLSRECCTGIAGGTGKWSGQLPGQSLD